MSPDFVGADTAGELAGIMAVHQVEALLVYVLTACAREIVMRATRSAQPQKQANGTTR